MAGLGWNGPENNFTTAQFFQSVSTLKILEEKDLVIIGRTGSYYNISTKIRKTRFNMHKGICYRISGLDWRERKLSLAVVNPDLSSSTELIIVDRMKFRHSDLNVRSFTGDKIKKHTMDKNSFQFDIDLFLQVEHPKVAFK